MSPSMRFFENSFYIILLVKESSKKVASVFLIRSKKEAIVKNVKNWVQSSSCRLFNEIKKISKRPNLKTEAAFFRKICSVE